jgi:type IV secretion system protein VirB10
VLLVAALILLVTLLAVVFLSTPLPPPRAYGLASPARLSGGIPGFLRTLPAPKSPTPITPPDAADGRDGAPGAPRSAAAASAATTPGDDPLLRLLEQSPGKAGPLSQHPPAQRAPDAPAPAARDAWEDAPVLPAADRRAAFLRALRSPLATSMPAESASWPARALAALSASPSSPSPQTLSPAPSASPAPPTDAAAAAAGTPAVPPGGRWESLAGRAATADAAGISLRRRLPPPPGTVEAGTLIPARLLTAVDSDLPGPLLAQVSRDVYDSRRRQVAIPRGTRLLGRYEDQVAAGQRRLLVAWTRLQLPGGATLELSGLPATDAAGAAGLPARTDNHLRRAFGDAILLSLLSAGAQLSQPPTPGFAQAPSPREIAAAALGQELSGVGLEIVRRDLAVQPTLHVPAATAFDVFVTTDLYLGSLPTSPEGPR